MYKITKKTKAILYNEEEYATKHYVDIETEGLNTPLKKDSFSVNIDGKSIKVSLQAFKSSLQEWKDTNNNLVKILKNVHSTYYHE